MKNVIVLTALLLPFLIAFEVHGRVSVSATNGGTFYIDDSQGNNQYALTLYATAEDAVTIFTITRTTEDDVILSIDIDSSNPGGNTGLEIGSQSEPLKEVQGISILNDDGFTYIASMHLSSHFGPATLNGIVFADIGGDTDKIDVVLNNRGNPFIGEMIVRGDVLGDITLEDDGDEVYGYLYVLDVRGSIGTPESLVNIAVGGWIVDLTAGEINANITGTQKEGPGSFVGQVFKIDSKKIGQSSGDIRGEIRCHMSDWPLIEEDVFIRAAGKMEGTIYVGGSLFEKIELMSEITTLEEEGLEGRIIINALNQGGSWTAPVKIGPYNDQIVIDGNGYAEPGEYPNSAASLGGGTIGVVPFRLHRTDCDPAHESVIDWDNATNKACMRHYGPVTWDTEDGEPYKVERRKAGSSDSWQAQDCFASTIDEDNDTIIWVKTTEVERFHRGFEYRVSRRQIGGENVLRCDLTIPGGRHASGRELRPADVHRVRRRPRPLARRCER